MLGEENSTNSTEGLNRSTDEDSENARQVNQNENYEEENEAEPIVDFEEGLITIYRIYNKILGIVGYQPHGIPLLLK